MRRAAPAPAATVIISSYNYAKYIGDAIESALACELDEGDLEILVADDGSTDDTAEVVERYPRVRFLALEHGGKARAFRAALARARGEILFTLDADDVYLPGRVATALEIYERYPTVCHVSHPSLILDEASGSQVVEELPSWLIGGPHDGNTVLARFYRRGVPFGGGSTFSARAVSIARRPPSDRVDMLLDEYLVLASLAAGDTYFFPQPLSTWRLHGANFSTLVAAASESRERSHRFLSSQDGILDDIGDLEIQRPVREVLALRARAARATLHALDGQRSLAEVLSLWRSLLALRPASIRTWLAVGRQYGVFSLSLPAGMVRAIRALRKRRSVQSRA
ncbi:MAG TPA: glycosyltransferase family A protein [Thermoanaerobaculia bacterium]|nr:glycosyltransferase family A protein [Thermoanaerobaculia bacterium]